LVVDNRGSGPRWAPDGKGIYYRQADPNLLIIKERELASGAERELLRIPAKVGGYLFSPDRRLIAALSADEPRSLLIIPTGGGEPRSVFQPKTSETLLGIQNMTWTPSSNAVIVGKMSNEDNHVELWEVPVDGRQPRKLDIDVSNWDFEGFRLSPDGKHIAFVGTAGKPGYEIWALENILPTAKPNK
jgi:Tol biopolymer transport system component